MATSKSRIIAFKYKGLSNLEHCIDIVQNNRLYCAPFTELNDPMEGKYRIAEDEEYEETIEQRVEGILGEKAKFRICALSKISGHQAMLAHYAEKHTGVIFEIELFESSNVYDVEYVKELPVVDVLKGKQKDIARNIFRYKLKDWEYEKEVRVISEDSFFGIPSNVKSITFATNADPDQAEPLVEACNKKRISIQYL